MVVYEFRGPTAPLGDMRLSMIDYVNRGCLHTLTNCCLIVALFDTEDDSFVIIIRAFRAHNRLIFSIR